MWVISDIIFIVITWEKYDQNWHIYFPLRKHVGYIIVHAGFLDIRFKEFSSTKN